MAKRFPGRNQLRGAVTQDQDQVDEVLEEVHRVYKFKKIC